MPERFEFPGFALPEAPVFDGAQGTSMFVGDFPDTVSMLDLAMVFGSRLWGHDVAPLDLDAPGLGDLFSHSARERATEALCERVAEELDEPSGDWWRALVLHTGSEAVETAVKTAMRATGRPKLVAFEGGYHGTFGLALAVTHRAEFREPWASQYAVNAVSWSPWGEVPKLEDDVACVVVEPWQGRAGVIPPPEGFLEGLREACDEAGALLVLDAVLCGSGRTGPVLVEGLEDARPDLICLGKALGCGLAASAVVARADVARAAWDHGDVEPAHTSTFLGDPVACTGVLRSLAALRDRAEELDDAEVAWRECLEPLAAQTGLELRGTGLLWALDTGVAGGGVEIASRLLHDHRIVVVPSGTDGSSITLYPAAVTTDLELERFAAALAAVVGDVAAPDA